MQIVTCIQNSLSLSGFRKVQVWHDAWHIAGVPAALPLLKIIIREAYIDTQATARILREQLSSLPAKMSELKGDITSFNAYVMTTLDQLRARGQTSNDLVSNLFKGYLSCADRTFVNYIEKKQEDYDEGATFTHTELMNLAANKYKTLVQAGKWLSPSAEEQKILALEAKVAKFGKQKSEAQKSSSGKDKGKTKGASDKGKNGKSSQKKDKKTTPEWMTKFPGDAFIAAGRPKVVEGKSYWWCPKHKRFVQHKPSECRLNDTAASNPPPSNHSESPSIRVSAALLMNDE
eukprot:scaffold41624_cov405-Amphora_coffeaeformis.AAC.1